MDGMSTGFTAGRILAIALPGAGMMLSLAEANAEREIVVDGIAGSADLFANEVVAAMGGDPGAGLRLTRRFQAEGLKVDAVMMNEARQRAAAEHVRRVRALQAGQAARERAEAEGLQPAAAASAAAAAASAAMAASAPGS